MGPGWTTLTAAVHSLRINNDLLMWEPADLLPTPDPTAHPPGFAGPSSGCWQDNFKMCKSAFRLGRGDARVGVPRPSELRGAGAYSQVSFPLGSLISPQTPTQTRRKPASSQ